MRGLTFAYWALDATRSELHCFCKGCHRRHTGKIHEVYPTGPNKVLRESMST